MDPLDQNNQNLEESTRQAQRVVRVLDISEPSPDCAADTPAGLQRPGYADILAALLAAAVMPIYLYGLPVAALMGTGILTALITEFICLRLRGVKRWPKGDFSCLATALITVLLLPATAPWWMAAVSTIIALAIAKHPFGGTGHTIFNPAAVGVAFSAICWPELAMRYPVPYSTYSLLLGAAPQYGSPPASTLRVGGTPKIDWFDVLLGKYPGPMGATCMIVLGCCLLFLLFRRRASMSIVLTSFGVVGAAALFLPRVVTGDVNSLIYEFSSGAFVFGITFMASEPASLPKTRAGRTFYGLLLGLLVVALRRYGQMELEFVYAILLANIFASSGDRYAARIGDWWNRLTAEPRKRAAARRRVKERIRERARANRA